MKRLIGILGALVMLAGVYLPAWDYDFSDQLHASVRFVSTHTVGPVMLILAIAALVVALVGRYEWLWATGFAALAVLATVLFIYAGKEVQVSAGGLFWPWDPGVRPSGLLPGVFVVAAGIALQLVAAGLRRGHGDRDH